MDPSRPSKRLRLGNVGYISSPVAAAKRCLQIHQLWSRRDGSITVTHRHGSLSYDRYDMPRLLLVCETAEVSVCGGIDRPVHPLAFVPRHTRG